MDGDLTNALVPCLVGAIIGGSLAPLSFPSPRGDLVEKHLPEQYRRKPGWRHVSNEIAKAAQGEKDLLEICVSLRLVLALEGVECLMQ